MNIIPPTRCSACGTTDFEPGSVVGKLAYIADQSRAKSWLGKSPDSEIRAFACRSCGHLKLFIDPHRLPETVPSQDNSNGKTKYWSFLK